MSTNQPTLFQPATGIDINGVINQQANTLAQLQTGVKPFVPTYQTAFARRHNEASTQTFFTFASAGHIWWALLSYTIVSSPTYVAATVKTFTDLSTGSGIGLLTLELGIANVSDHDSDAIPGQWNGLPITAGDTLVLNINGAVSVPNLTQQASCIVGFSIP